VAIAVLWGGDGSGAESCRSGAIWRSFIVCASFVVPAHIVSLTAGHRVAALQDDENHSRSGIIFSNG